MLYLQGNKNASYVQGYFKIVNPPRENAFFLCQKLYQTRKSVLISIPQTSPPMLVYCLLAICETPWHGRLAALFPIPARRSSSIILTWRWWASASARYSAVMRMPMTVIVFAATVRWRCPAVASLWCRPFVPAHDDPPGEQHRQQDTLSHREAFLDEYMSSFDKTYHNTP